MKYSNYNIIFDSDNEEIKYLINTFTGEAFKINNEIANYINNNNINMLKQKQEIFQDYIKKGVIIKKEFNEIDFLKYTQNNIKFNSRVLYLTIFMTTDCNFSCVYCFEGLEKEKIYLNDIVRDRIFKFIENILNQNQNIDIIHIILFGGEPLMNIKNLCLDKQKIFSSSLITNGSLISTSVLDFLKEINCETVQITLDGEKEFHNQRRIDYNKNGTFEKVI